MKNDHVSPIGGMDAIGDLVRQDVLAVVEVGLHRLTIDLMRLEEKDIDDGKNGKRHDDCFKKIKEK